MLLSFNLKGDVCQNGKPGHNGLPGTNGQKVNFV